MPKISPLPEQILVHLRKFAEMRSISAQVELHLLQRLERLENHCVPELQAIVQRIEALEATDQLDADAWASIRRANSDLHHRLLNLEAAQQQQFLAHLNTPLTETDRKELGLPSAELDDGDGIAQQQPADHFRDATEMPPTPEAAPVATDAELYNAYNNAPGNGFGLALRAVYNLNREPSDAQPPATQPTPQPTPPAAPAGELVEIVSAATLQAEELPGEEYERAAITRIAIRHVAAWLDLQGQHGCSLLLREEVDR
jgi:hypothetical protein